MRARTLCTHKCVPRWPRRTPRQPFLAPSAQTAPRSARAREHVSICAPPVSARPEVAEAPEAAASQEEAAHAPHGASRPVRVEVPDHAPRVPGRSAPGPGRWSGGHWCELRGASRAACGWPTRTERLVKFPRGCPKWPVGVGCVLEARLSLVLRRPYAARYPLARRHRAPSYHCFLVISLPFFAYTLYLFCGCFPRRASPCRGNIILFSLSWRTPFLSIIHNPPPSQTRPESSHPLSPLTHQATRSSYAPITLLSCRSHATLMQLSHSFPDPCPDALESSQISVK